MTFYFYDLETSSGSPRNGRIMQFAGQRTDEDLKPIGEPDNILIKLADDILPEPDAILVHGITPQQTLTYGISEAEFTKYFNEEIATPNTTFVGFNNIRFDDEFTRRICYRNFYDPYQWHWKEGRSRWDLLDPIRMMRALRPDGLKWPYIDDKPTVKLELMAKENGLMHEKAHDALSDVEALIQLAQKFKDSQGKLYNYLLKMRDKKAVAELALDNEPFVYTSGKYSSKHEKTSVVITLFKHPRRDSAVVYDLTKNPDEWLEKSVKDLVKHWQVRFGDDIKPLPVKTVQFNRCPAVAPISVLDDISAKRLNLDKKRINDHLVKLAENPEFTDRLQQALDVLENEQQARLPLNDAVDEQIYDGFWSESDQNELRKIRKTKPDELSSLTKEIKNKRIREMLPLYKARNYPELLDEKEIKLWEQHRKDVLVKNGKFTKLAERMNEIAKSRKLNQNDEYLLTELQLYSESILPEISE